MTNPLTADEKTSIQLADRKAVVAALSTALAASPGRWLAPNHIANIGIEKRHAPAGAMPIGPQELAEYLAIASPTHCSDGWSYLARALHSYLVGDAHSAWHFAYYAELRAGQSILSSVGYGAFNTWNSSIDSAGVLHPTSGRGTHDMVWQALTHVLSNNTSAAAAIADGAELLAHTLPELIQYAYPGASPAATASTWVSSWMFDLSTAAADKHFRNQCSYNPHVVTPHSANVLDTVTFLRNLWPLLEPIPKASFIELDKQIIRSALRQQARENLELVYGRVPTDVEVGAELSAAYGRIVASAPAFQNAVPLAFIANALTPEDPIVAAAKDTSPQPANPEPALARATLLLRLATGVSARLLRDAGCDSSIGFWLDALAVEQGLLNATEQPPVDRWDFYLDCSVALDDLSAHCATLGLPLNRAAVLAGPSVRTHTICQTERVVQWGLAA